MSIINNSKSCKECGVIFIVNSKSKGLQKFCSKRCSSKNARKFIVTTKVKRLKEIDIPRLCDDGCGQMVSGYYINRTVGSPFYHKKILRRFIHGHSNKTELAKKANSVRKTGNRNRIGLHHTKETKNKISIKKKVQSIKPWLGKKRSDKDRKTMSIARRKGIVNGTIKLEFPSSNTGIEVKSQEQLKMYGIFFETQKGLYGTPDIFILDPTGTSKGICYFADGCPFHPCPIHKRHPQVSLKYTDKELIIYQNKIKKILEAQGYIVIRVWGHDIIKANFNILDHLPKYLSQYYKKMKNTKI
jgi:G:T-mismatch repair DNA endonuclease (very short patch repair protein)